MSFWFCKAPYNVILISSWYCHHFFLWFLLTFYWGLSYYHKTDFTCILTIIDWCYSFDYLITLLFVKTLCFKFFVSSLWLETLYLNIDWRCLLLHELSFGFQLNFCICFSLLLWLQKKLCTDTVALIYAGNKCIITYCCGIVW